MVGSLIGILVQSLQLDDPNFNWLLGGVMLAIGLGFSALFFFMGKSVDKVLEIREIQDQDREGVNKFLREHWGATDISVRGEIIDGTKLNGFIVYKGKKIIGLVTYIIYDNNECELVTIDSLRENRGTGTQLIGKVKEIAVENKCDKIKLVTSNSNIRAMGFYQKRGFILSNVYINEMEAVRKLKPEIPLVADNGIPIRDGLEFTLVLETSEN